MNNFTYDVGGIHGVNKLALEALVEAGAEVSFVAYDPNTVVGTPEATAIAAGWIQYYREATASLVEVIYTR